MESAIQEFYKNKNLFITGATGFVGACLIEKILRTLPECGNLYILMRAKKNKTIPERLEELTKNSVFEKYTEADQTKLFMKLIPIQGDVGEEFLGISETDKKTLVENVHVVIHSAATLDFFDNLRSTVTINLLGTRRVMELCAQLTNLQAMVQVSSAYVNSFLNEAEEILYPPPADAEDIIEKVEKLEDIYLKELEPRILKDHPNTYTLTKHLAEHEVNKFAEKFPCVIVRPSMITSAWKEPNIGWTISKNGPQGFLMGAAKGVIRRLPLNPNLISDYIPVDVVVNEILVAAYETNKQKVQGGGKPFKLLIFHCTSSTYRPFRFASIAEKVNSYLYQNPLKSAVWHPHMKFSKNLFLFRIAAIFFHFIPGFFFDLMLRMSGQRPILIRLHTNVWKSLNTLEKFIFSEWKFDNTKTLQLAKSLNATDRKLFYIDIGELKWDEYFYCLLLGVRKYLSKEPLSTLESAKKKATILRILHILVQILFYWGVWWLIKALFGLSNAKAAIILPVFYSFFSIL